jgi:hypothetical protein
MKRTNYNDLYGEAIQKTFLPPIRVYSLINYDGSTRTQDEFGFDSIFNITVNFHKRRLSEDQDLFVRPGDFIQYDAQYFEITDVFEDARYLFGQDVDFADGNALAVQATCRQARKGLFNPGKRI